MNLKSFENIFWQKYDQVICFRHIASIELILKYGIKKILDVGAGDGLFLDMCRKNNVAGQAIEVSDIGFNKCIARGIVTYQKDISDENFNLDATYDCVVCLDVLEHNFDPDSVLKNLVKLSDKYVIVGVPNFNSLPARIQVAIGRVPENNSPRKGHCFWFNKMVLETMIRNNNLDIVELRYNTFFSGLYFTKVLARLWPSLFALSFIVLAKKK